MKKIALFCLCFVAILPVLYGIFHRGFFVTDDGGWMVIRLSAFYEALRQGQFPVRFLPRLNNGFGYPVADFLYPLFLYLGSFIHVFHVNFQTTIKIIFALSFISSFVGSFVWLKKLFGQKAACIGALTYTLLPYHVWDMTKRGSLGEVLALGIVPFIFWAIDGGNAVISGVLIGFLMLSHNSLALLFLPVIILYSLLRNKWKEAVFTSIIGLGISAFFWIPALFDKQFTVFDMTPVSNVSQYFLGNNFYSLVGIVTFFVCVVSIFLILKNFNKSAVFFLIITVLSLLMTLSLANIVWQVLPLGKYIQFPFRFLSLTTLGIGFLASFIVARGKQFSTYLFVILLILLFVSSWQYITPQKYQYYPDSYYSTNQDTTTVKNEYLPLWAKQTSPTRIAKVGISSGNITSVIDNGSKISLQTSSSQSALLSIAILYFPGWIAQIDSKIAKITPSNPYGFVTVSVPKGNHAVNLYFTETPVRLFADSISLLSILTIIAIAILKKRKK